MPTRLVSARSRTIAQEFMPLFALFHAPTRFERVRRRIAFLEPGKPATLEFAAIRLDHAVQIAELPFADQAVFIVDFHQRHRRIIGISKTGIAVAMSQQIARILFLHGDHRRVEKIDALPVLGRVLSPIGKAGIFAADMQIDVAVNAVPLQGGDKVVETVKLGRIERFHVFLQQAIGRGASVQMMETHGIDAETRQPGGDFVGFARFRESAAEYHIHAQKTDALLAGIKMPPFGAHKTELARRLVIPAGKIGPAGRIGRHDKGKEFGARD